MESKQHQGMELLGRCRLMLRRGAGATPSPDVRQRRSGRPWMALVLATMAWALGACDRHRGGSVQPSLPTTNANMPPKHAFDESLPSSAKAAIDTWIRTNKLNRFGDPIGTVYPGGSPLFDEMTGREMSRYEYILGRHKSLWTNLPGSIPNQGTNPIPSVTTMKTNSVPPPAATLATNLPKSLPNPKP